MNALFKTDFYRMTGNEWKVNLSNICKFIFQHNIRFMYHYRKYSQNHSVYRKYKIYRYSRKYGIEFAPDVQIGKGLYLGHPYNITVGGGVKIGIMLIFQRDVH